MLMKVQKHIRPLREDPFTFVVRLLNEGYEVEYMPEVDDMLPLIRGGKDVVTLRSPEAELEPGHIVLAEFPGRGYVLRRIVDRNQNRIWVMADTDLDWLDMEECTVNDIAGQVVFIQRGALGFRPGKGRFWMRLMPFRRKILSLYSCWLSRMK
ncbi:S24/S26 family peptidase [Selenomonas ruminantium]|uniref:S24/S26 family peptidase n=1 Tax=Selenomonas ruminantium TaxID=971 RepID=UPI0026EE4F54|nr:S24/S26 family peptidase [Selenomonas ruminantium]